MASWEKYPEPFLVGLDVEAMEAEPLVSPSPSWQNLPHPRATPFPCFTTQQEELMVGNIFSQFDRQIVRQVDEEAALRTQTYRSIMQSRHGNQAAVVEPLLLLSGNTRSLETGGNLLPDLEQGENPVHGYVPYGDMEEESSSSSDEDDEEAVSGEAPGDIPHNLLLDPVDPPTGNLVNLSDSIKEAAHPQTELLTEPPALVDMGVGEVVSNSGYLEEGDLLGLGLASSSSTAQGQPFDPFADNSTQQSGPRGVFSTLSPTPMQPASAPPTKPQPAASQDFMTFSNPAALSGSQFHSHPTAAVPFQTQSVSQPQPRPDPFADLTSLGTQLPTSGRSKPQPTSTARMKTNALPPQGSQRPVVGKGSCNHGSYSSVIGRRDERGTRSSGGRSAPRPFTLLSVGECCCPLPQAPPLC